MSFRARRLREGDVIGAGWLNEIVAEVERLGKVRVGGALSVFSGPGGLAYSASVPVVGKVAKTGGSTIPAISGTTPGSGAVTISDFDGTTLTARSDTVTAYNMSSTAIAASTWLIVVDVDGRWMVVFENCP